MSEEEIRKYVGELFKVVNTTSILVIDRKGTLHRLNCPFRVVATMDVLPDIIEGKVCQVVAVKMSLDLKDIFIINEKGFYIWGFLILID